MIEVNFKEFSFSLKEFLNEVADKNKSLLIKRKSGKNVIMISLDEYNSIMETLHLLGSAKNSARLFESIQQLNSRKKAKPELSD